MVSSKPGWKGAGQPEESAPEVGGGQGLPAFGAKKEAAAGHCFRGQFEQKSALHQQTGGCGVFGGQQPQTRPRPRHAGQARGAPVLALPEALAAVTDLSGYVKRLADTLIRGRPARRP
ncbi:MAG TPA: hypothetical protein VF378_06295 [Geothrix sp.]